MTICLNNLAWGRVRLNALGTQLLLELKGCNRVKLNDLGFIRNCLLSAAESVGATILSESFHQFSPQGVTGIVAIAESHFSIHTWPEYGYAAADIFTCGVSFQPDRAAALIVKALEAEEPTIIELKRGVLQKVPVA